MEILLYVAGVLLAIAATLTLIRIMRGPGPADRIVATDVLIATVACLLAVEAALHRHAYTIPIILVLSLLAFVGTVSMSRFVAGRSKVVGTGPAGTGPAIAEPAVTDDPDEGSDSP